MNWTTIKSGLARAMMMNRMLLLASLFAGITLLSAQTTGGASATINSTLCNIIATVQEVVGVVSILLFVIGGVLYAVAHMMPAAGQFRGAMQGWSMGMIVGGVIGLILVIMAPGIVSFVITSGSAAGAGGTGGVITPTCGGGGGGVI